MPSLFHQFTEGASQMNAERIIAGWKQRLSALANSPEFVYRDTPQGLIEQDCRRQDGGYYRTLLHEGGSSMEFPALNSGERPLDQAQPRKP